jgi:hypothetical protein
MIRVSILLILFVVLISCKVYHFHPNQQRDISQHEPARKAFVVNRELVKEFAILKSSGIFLFVDDSVSTDVIKVNLSPLHKTLACGNGAFITLLTVGQVPVKYPDRYLFTFTEILDNVETEKSFELNVATSVWFWNVFSSHKNFQKETGLALSADYYSKSPATVTMNSLKKP